MSQCRLDFAQSTVTLIVTFITTSAYSANPVLVSRASRSAVASFSQLEADRKVTT